MGRPGPGGVPHARGRVDRAGPDAACPVPRASAGRAPGVPVRDRRGRRPFGVADMDVGQDAFTLDNPACEWFGLGAAARVSAGGHTWAIGVAEVIVPGGGETGGNDGPSAHITRNGPSDAGVIQVCPTGSRDITGSGPRPGAGVAGPRPGAGVAGPRPGAGVAGPRPGAGVPGWPEAGRGGGWLAGGCAGTGCRAGRARGHRDVLPRGRPAIRVARPGLEPARRPNRGRRPRRESVDGAPGRRARPRRRGRDRPAGRPGGAQVWVPAARPRAELFTASADVRGDRDLPVLIVSGADLPAAVAELTADLADAVIDAELAGAAPGAATPGGPGPHDRLLGSHSVALLNRGTPSSLVTTDGTMYITLMRASSAWPAGVWIDGTRRTVPDGSSFAWQHWRHEFRYALAAGTGDWREAGFVMAGPGVQPRHAHLRNRPARRPAAPLGQPGRGQHAGPCAPGRLVVHAQTARQPAG